MGLKKLLGLKKKKEPACPYYWEWYNRTSLVAGKIKELGLDDPSVLDVGGTAKDNLLKKFGPGRVTSLNILADSDVVASADRLPFRDRSFDCAACIDTLEHVPRQIRDGIVYELLRVASKAVFIVAPVDTEENNRAERLVLKHLSVDFVKEHQVFGLVDFGGIRSAVERSPQAERVAGIEESDLDDLMYWTAAMLGDKIEASRLYQELYFLENKFHPRRKLLAAYLR